MKLSVSLYVVLAVGGSSMLSHPVFADPPPEPPAPLFEIYGTLVPFLEYGQAAGATPRGPRAALPRSVPPWSPASGCCRGSAWTWAPRTSGFAAVSI